MNEYDLIEKAVAAAHGVKPNGEGAHENMGSESPRANGAQGSQQAQQNGKTFREDTSGNASTGSAGRFAAWRRRTFGADTLQHETFPALTYLLPDLVPEGLCLLVSRPKLGKSWLALDIALATAAGRLVLGTLKPTTGEVLYLALEDGPRRLQRRLSRLLPTFSGTWPPGLTFATEWPRSDQGGLSDIEAWIKDTLEKGSHPRLVIIDTLAHFRKPAAGKNAYLEDYAALASLQKMAGRHNLSIVVVHHDRKAAADDPFDTISGTLGVTGAVDTIALLKREAGGFTFYVRGRDIEEAEKALRFDKDTCRWTILGEASEIRRSDERARVLDALDGVTDGMSPADLSSSLGISSANAKQILHRMAKAGEIRKEGRGRYFHINVPVTMPVTSVTLPQQAEKENKIRMIPGDSDKVTEVTGGLSRVTAKPADSEPAQASTVPRSCAQCHGTPDGTEEEIVIDGDPVWLHEQCEGFYRAGDGWGDDDHAPARSLQRSPPGPNGSNS